MQLLLIKMSSPTSTPYVASVDKLNPSAKFEAIEWLNVAGRAKGRKVVLLIPNAECISVQAEVPSKNRKQLMQAVPYVIEESVAEDLDDLHFVAHQPNKDKSTAITAINKERLAEWVDLSFKHRFPLTAILPEHVMLTCADKELHIHCTDGVCTVKSGQYRAHQVPSVMLDKVIPDVIKTYKPERILTNVDLDELASDDLEIEQYDAQMQADLTQASQAMPLNLLTGYASRRSSFTFNWRPWKQPMMAAAVLLLTLFVLMIGRNVQLNRQMDSMDAALRGMYKEVFPGSKRYARMAQRIQSEHKKLLGAGGNIGQTPIKAMSEIAPDISKHKAIKVDSISYAGNEIKLTLSAPAIAMLEKLKTELINSSKMAVEIKSTSITSDKVEGVIVINTLGQAQ